MNTELTYHHILNFFWIPKHKCFSKTFILYQWLASIYLVSMYDAITGFLFLLRFVGRDMIILDTGSVFFFSPRGLSHCCGKLVDEGSDGISLYPEIFHCSSALITAKTCAHCPDTLHNVYYYLSLTFYVYQLLCLIIHSSPSLSLSLSDSTK